jgi:hypothetical protein
MRNLQEGRHRMAERIFHGRRGRIYRRYYEGMEDQLGALGLVLNCVVLWNTFYMNAALEKLRASGYQVLDEDVARLSPFCSTVEMRAYPSERPMTRTGAKLAQPREVRRWFRARVMDVSAMPWSVPAASGSFLTRPAVPWTIDLSGQRHCRLCYSGF